MRTIVLLCSGPSNTAVYLSPMQAESTSRSMAPEKEGVPVWPSISVRLSPVHAATPFWLASKSAFRPIR